MRRFLVILALALAAVGCKNVAPLLPNVSGKAGEVIVVMEKADWEGSLGNATRELLASDCPYLVQREPLYSLINITPSNFTDLFKIHRNIVIFNVTPQSDTTAVVYRHNIWSQPQCVIQVHATDSESAEQLIKEKSHMILGSIEQAERDRVINNSLLYEQRDVTEKVSAYFGGSPHFPTGYTLKKASEDFFWIGHDTQYVYQDIFVYRYPVEESEPFTEASIISHHNEMLQNNVPGMFEGTYMTTADYFTPQIESIKYRGRQFMQTRGMWEVKNDFMGGPFVSHSFYSPDGQYVIVAEAFVYAPRYDKRQYLRQVESILYSWEWAEKDEK